ncbi:MAG: transposase [bacterium]
MKYIDNQYYHIYNRGAHKALIFFNSENYRYCLDVLKNNASRHNVLIAAYCLMPNHYHLVMKQLDSGSISRCIQTTFNTYTQAINVRRNHSGTMFQGKAKAKLVNSDSYVFQLIRYVHLNPVEAQLVTRPEDWIFSDYADWAGIRERKTFNSSLRDMFFKNGEEYKEFVQQHRREEIKKNIGRYLMD